MAKNLKEKLLEISANALTWTMNAILATKEPRLVHANLLQITIRKFNLSSNNTKKLNVNLLVSTLRLEAIVKFQEINVLEVQTSTLLSTPAHQATSPSRVSLLTLS